MFSKENYNRRSKACMLQNKRFISISTKKRVDLQGTNKETLKSRIIIEKSLKYEKG